MRKFRIYYAILPSNDITNCIAPGYRHVTGDNTPEGIAKRKKAQEDYIKTLNQKNKFYIKLEESMLEDGIVNPILIQAGYCTKIYRKYLPIEHQQKIAKALCCDRNGGSRLFIAQQHNLAIPCIISDFSSRFVDDGFEELKDEQEIMRKYAAKPKRIIINDHGVHIGQPVHVHLSDDQRWRWKYNANKNKIRRT